MAEPDFSPLRIKSDYLVETVDGVKSSLVTMLALLLDAKIELQAENVTLLNVITLLETNNTLLAEIKVVLEEFPGPP